MILTTTESVPGREVERALGMVRGSTVRTRFVFRHIMAAMRGLVGGEVPEYTKVLAEAREQALDRLKAQAQALGADAVVMVRFSSSEIMRNAAEIVVYGTAVLLVEEPEAP